MTRCSTGRATQKYRGNGTDLSDILETPGDIIYADAAVSAENLVISGTTGDVLKVSASGIPEWGTSTSQWITSGDDISYSLGHVGIGTTSPDANLHVTGNAFVSTDLSLGGTLTMGNVLVEALHELSAITATGNVTPHVIEFTNPTTGLVTTGNVGIGTSSPLETLDVYGGFLVRPERTTKSYFNTWPMSGPSPFYLGGPITGPTITVSYSKNAIYTTTGGLKVSPPNTGFEYFYETRLYYSSFENLYVHYPASRSTESPYLSGDVFSSTRFKADNTEDFTGFAIGQDYEAGNSLTDYSQPLDIARAHSAHMYFKTASSDGSLTEKMRITNAGNVGIGTSSPQGTLHVSSGTTGDCRLILQADTDNNNEGDNPRIEFWQDGAIQESAIGMTSNRLNFWNSVGSGGIAFHTNTVDGWTNAIERMTITSTGEVGIGATVPARLFHVNGTSRFEGEVEWYEAGQSTSHANYGANRDWYIRSGGAGGKVVIQDASTASYVGIGTSSPGYKLDVNGDINLTGSLRINGVAQTFGGGGGSGTSQWVTVNSTEIHYSGGNVGIGTSDPAHTLHVEGNIYASGNVTAFSDKRKKTNLRIIEDSVKKLEQINGYTYDKDGTEYTGLIAQEVLHILPQAVVGSEEEGYGLAYGNMVGILVEAIKELSNEVKNLKEKLSS